MNEEVEAAKKRGYIVFTTSQKHSRLGPYSEWCSVMLKPQIYVHITGKKARPEMDLIFVKFNREQVREAMYEAIKRLYAANGDDNFVERALRGYGIGVTYNTVKCNTPEQAENIAKGYVEIYKTIILPIVEN